VNFEVTGGRIIGVGNGDPGCHEPDRFIETVALFPVEDWRGRIAPAGTAAPAAPESLPPFPRWATGRLRSQARRGLRSFRHVHPAGRARRRQLELFLPTLGAKTTLWLNGRELARDIDTSKVGPALRLDPAQLVAGVNRVQLMVTPFDDKKNHIPRAHAARLRACVTPAPPARRSLFNGLAQVIVQSTREPGEIRLTALQVADQPEQRAPVVEAVAAAHIVAGPGDGVVVLVDVTLLRPLLVEQGERLLGQLTCARRAGRSLAVRDKPGSSWGPRCARASSPDP
jgi:hypothetical protein